MKMIMSTLEQVQKKKETEKQKGQKEEFKSPEFQMNLSGHEKNYLKQLNKFNQLKWMIPARDYRAGQCFGEIDEATVPGGGTD